MQIPESLVPLFQQGVLDEVIRPLQSGKEAQIYLVLSGGEERVAKVYKEAQNRTFKNRAEYTEGRKVRNSRDQRAMDKRSRYGRAQDEAAWRSTEVDMIYRLRDAGVSVPTPYHFIDGVLIMELVRGADGHPAPRLGELEFSRKDATHLFEQLLAEVVRMLCAGVVHGDLSEFNVLMGAQGPVIIDFPQAVTAAGNQNARTLLVRDVDNLQRFVTRFAPGRPARPYAQEAWQLFERGELTRHTTLTGDYTDRAKYSGAGTVLAVIKDAEYDERRRRQTSGRNMRGLPAPERKVETIPAASGSQRPQQQQRSDAGGQVRGRQEPKSGHAGPTPRRAPQAGQASVTADGRRTGATPGGPSGQPAAHRRRRRRRKPAQNSQHQPRP